MPAWVNQACNHYLTRLPRDLQLNTIEVPLIKRGKNPDIQRIVRDESRKVMESIPAGCSLVALDVKGRKVSTEKLATTLNNWMQQGNDIAIVIVGFFLVSRWGLEPSSRVANGPVAAGEV